MVQIHNGPGIVNGICMSALMLEKKARRNTTTKAIILI